MKDYDKSLKKLVVGIGKKYVEWSGVDDTTRSSKMDKLTIDIKMKSIKEFKESLSIKPGRKFDKILHGSSVWGFVAKSDGVFKGHPIKRGDVFKAAGWRAPAKHARGTIFSSDTNWFSWTGPAYLCSSGSGRLW